MKKFLAVGAVLLAPLVLCAADPADAHKEMAPQKAIAVLHPASGSQVHGTVVFTQKDGYIEITGEIEGLTPGEHAFHIHEFGDCSAPDAMSAGGHFNPEGSPHGHEDADPSKRHVGDMGNITADENGKAKIDKMDKVMQLHGPHSIIGRAVIVHAKVDDFSQPTGNAGGRIACGVVGVAKAAAPTPPPPK